MAPKKSTKGGTTEKTVAQKNKEAQLKHFKETGQMLPLSKAHEIKESHKVKKSYGPKEWASSEWLAPMLKSPLKYENVHFVKPLGMPTSDPTYKKAKKNWDEFSESLKKAKEMHKAKSVGLASMKGKSPAKR
ncbi:hypothetical protein TetV_362 [Tetraselmis virus 1]|uniref:Uncharacterized protein n=1 Tax=Tetraselmis virus 1 TaxID=2060617 RepID=A0A2P0VNH4_9VIRU|nr:hypothetical protein QJ968_gp362 [Tetraselmis virus 1]AUF82454.1 hypothetical protein TetV_362 [Tetraselmis virus 1]